MQTPKRSWASIPSNLCYVTTATLMSACKQTLATEQFLPTCFNASSEVRRRFQVVGHLTSEASHWSTILGDDGSPRGCVLRPCASDPGLLRTLGRVLGRGFQLTQCPRTLVIPSGGVFGFSAELGNRWGSVRHICLKASSALSFHSKLRHRPNLLSHFLTDAGARSFAILTSSTHTRRSNVDP